MNERAQTGTGRTTKRLQNLVVLVFFGLALGWLTAACTSDIQEKKPAESPFKPLPEDRISTDLMEDVDFSKFEHDSERHRSVPCLMCHQRSDEATAPRFSSHATCTGCHAQQFKDETHPICATCHTEAGSEKLKPFPAMQSFKAHFNHAAHVRETDCATCHRPQGAAMSVPARAAAHETCFQCHTSDKVVGERNIGSCATCHEPGKPNRIDPSPAVVGFNFSHARHASQSCTSCHGGGSGDHMSAITVAMHGNRPNSCASCHNEQKAFGANDFSDCRKCHQEVAGVRGFGIRFDHDRHAKQDCATCHKPGGTGVNFSVPNSEAAHQTCFRCHSPNKDTGVFRTGKCFTCHQPGSGNDVTPSRAVVPGNFSHTKHSFFDCDSCHTKTGGRMNVPSVEMHKPSKSGSNCATCHNNDAAFGEDFASCKRCHTGGRFKLK